MGIKTKSAKAAKIAFTSVLLVGVVGFVGLLSFSGWLLINPYIAWASIAFFLSGVVEVEIYKQNIWEGLTDLKLLGPYGIHKLTIEALDKHLKLFNEYVKARENARILADQIANEEAAIKAKGEAATEEEKKKLNLKKSVLASAVGSLALAKSELQLEEDDPKLCPFYEDYLKQKNIVNEFNQGTLSDDQEKEKHEAKKRLEKMCAFFVSQVANTSTEKDNYLSGAQLQKFKDMLPNFRKRILLARLALPACILGGMGAGFAAASSLNTALTVTFVASAAALSASIWPLAAVAGIGFVFLVFRTISEIILSDKFKNWKKFTLDRLKRKRLEDGTPTEKAWVHALRVTGIVALVLFATTVAVGATIATAGTWWYATQKGIALIPMFTKVAEAIGGVLVSLVAITNLPYNVMMSLLTVKLMMLKMKLQSPIRYIKNKVHEWKNKYHELRKKENLAQVFNPLRILGNFLQIVYTPIVYLGHFIATGLMADRLGNLNPYIPMTVSGASEAFQDLHQLVEGGHDHGAEKCKDDHEHDHDHADHEHVHDVAEEHEEEEEHDHHHGQIPQFLFRWFVISPLLFLSACVDYGAKRVGYMLDEKKEVPSRWRDFVTSFRKSFDLKEKEEPVHVTPTADPKNKVSNEWIAEEATMVINKQYRRLLLTEHQPEIGMKKLHAVFDNVIPKFKSDVSRDQKIANLRKLDISERDKKTFSTQRFPGFFSPPQTRSAKFVTKLEKLKAELRSTCTA